MLNNEKSRFPSGKTIYKTLLMLLFTAITITNLQAGDKIRIKLHQPPPNKMPVSSLWQMDIENTTRENVTIYLVGTVNGDRLGEILGGKSKPFSVKPGKSTYGYDDFKSGEVKWVNKTIQEIIFRKGDVTEDNYTICVSAYYEDGNTADQENCISHQVQQMGTISLISPSDNEEIDPDTLPGLSFNWVKCPLCPPPYNLRIVELKGDQSPDVAIKENRPILDKEGIKGTNYQYSLTDTKLEEGKKYAWQVKNGDITSEAYTIHIKLKRPPLNELITQFKLELQKEGKTVNETKTDTSGNFRFSSVENGEYRLKITSDGSPMPDRLLLSFGPGGIIICCCPGPPCEDPLVIIMGDEKTRKLKALYFEGGEISAKILPFPPVGPHIPHR